MPREPDIIEKTLAIAALVFLALALRIIYYFQASFDASRCQ